MSYERQLSCHPPQGATRTLQDLLSKRKNPGCTQATGCLPLGAPPLTLHSEMPGACLGSLPPWPPLPGPSPRLCVRQSFPMPFIPGGPLPSSQMGRTRCGACTRVERARLGRQDQCLCVDTELLRQERRPGASLWHWESLLPRSSLENQCQTGRWFWGMRPGWGSKLGPLPHCGSSKLCPKPVPHLIPSGAP